MENLSLISIVLPTYNRAELLPRAIESVLAQSYTCWELIVWDDGSTDTTAEIVKFYRDERIRYFFSENRGAAYARNRAVDASRGKYIAFLDSDDEWLGEKLQVQVNILDSYSQIEFLFSDFMNVIETSNEVTRNFEQCARAMNLLEVENINDSVYIILRGMLEGLASENFIATDTAIFRRDVWERTHPFNEELRNGEDFELWWRMGLGGICFAYINTVYLTRYKPTGSLSDLNIVTCENAIKSTDFCLQAALSNGREDLIPYLNHRYSNIWSNMIVLFGYIGDSKRMLNAFVKSIKYEVSLGVFRLLFQAFLMYIGFGAKR